MFEKAILFPPTANRDAQPVLLHPDYPPGAQPMAFVDAQAPRSFLAAGATDDMVDPERNTATLAPRSKAAGVPVNLHGYVRANNLTLVGAFGLPLRWLAPVLDDVTGFVADAPLVARPSGSTPWG